MTEEIKIVTVQDLIDSLNEVEDKTKPVFLYNCATSQRYEDLEIDDTLTDAVDINFGEEEAEDDVQKMNHFLKIIGNAAIEQVKEGAPVNAETIVEVIRTFQDFVEDKN